MKIWLISQTIIDIFLFFLIFVYIINIKKKLSINQKRDVDLVKITKILESMNVVMKDSEKVSEKLVNTVDSKSDDIKNLQRQLDIEKEKWKEMLDTVKNTRESFSLDKYQKVSLLFKKGEGVDEIAKETSLSKGEIELIRKLKM